MGALVQKASESLTSMVIWCSNEVRLAHQVEAMLGEELLVAALEEGYFCLSQVPARVSYIGIEKTQTREFVNRMRRALKVPSMERRLDQYRGAFKWVGVSTEIYDGSPLEVEIAATNEGCEIKRIEETGVRVRFEADCKPEKSFLTDEGLSARDRRS